ncbi:MULTISPECIES: ATP-binding protein [unclassified Nocardioides]|uniref:sensor histidine kinase n=1 Tax=unclassified Nocardioides TaxID=2615069 RepID=UPI0006745B13|nr:MULTISPECIES: ATP-binding protein [unclassified Nocardioides]
MSAGRPVARLVQPVIVRVTAMAALMALIAVLGVVLSTAAVNHLTDDLQPAAAANQDVYQDLTDMSAAVESWSASGQRAAADRFTQALVRFPADQQKVRRFADGDDELEMLVTRQERVAQAWIERFAQPRIDAEGGTPPAAGQVRSGAAAFEAVRSAHQDTTQAFDSRVRQARADASLRLKGTVLAVVLLAGAAWYVISRSRRRLMTELSEPLLALEQVVQRMAKQDHDVRAKELGPKEVRAVASALNAFADAQGRARAVEGRIQSELRSLDTARDDFVSNVSHELRTPLTTISGYLELVAEEFEGRMDPPHERMLEATRRNVARLKALIDDLLALSRAEGRRSDFEPVDLALLVREAVTDVRITAARRRIRLEVDTPEDVVPVLADRAMLHRALLNVLSNAVKFSHDDGTVDVVLTVLGGQVEVRVTDHGIGIPGAEIERLGTRFFRASNAVTNEIAGTGLGLRITQTIIDRHSGEVVIESEEGEGTSVVVRLRRHGDGLPPLLPHEIVAEEEARAAALRARGARGAGVEVVDAADPERPAGDTDGTDAPPRIVPAFPRRR